jgi:hypothetical protein
MEQFSNRKRQWIRTYLRMESIQEVLENYSFWT